MTAICDKALENTKGGFGEPGGSGAREHKEYNIGDRVEIYTFLFFTKRATVISKVMESFGYRYEVRYEDGSTEWVCLRNIQD